MNTTNDLRASERVPITNRVHVVSKGKVALYALAINIGTGGLLLNASTPLPVGSPCRLAILPSDSKDSEKILVQGTVVRNDENGTAVQFSNILEENTFVFLARNNNPLVTNSIINSYRAYFKVSQNKNNEGSERLLGVSSRTFKTVFLTTFCACIPLAILPVWALRESIPQAPNWLKITASFGYAGIWLGIIQPTIDLTVFRYLKNRKLNT